jgi:AcrR family transcriptional regulator
MSTTTVPPRTPGRPRSETTHQAILDAALELLATEDYRSISIDRIATRAKVGKQSIYRWWCSKAEVIFAAYKQRSIGRMAPQIPSGDVFADIEDLLRRIIVLNSNELVARGLRSLVAEAQLDPEFRKRFHDEFIQQRRAQLREILQHGIALNQIRADLDVELTIDMLYGVLWSRLLSGAAPSAPEYVSNLIALVRPGMAARRE